MMSTGNESRSKSRISGRTRGNSRQYSLRSKSESPATSNTKEDILLLPRSPHVLHDRLHHPHRHLKYALYAKALTNIEILSLTTAQQSLRTR